MKGKRSKQYRKLLQQYALAFGFREPYQILVDANIIQDSQRFSMDLVASLERTLSAKVKPMITQCSIRHLYALKDLPQPQKDSLIATAKSMERRRCNHHTLEEPLSTLDCFSSVIDSKNSLTNRNRYVVASQDEEVRRHCRGIQGVPLIYVKRSVMVMEPMAKGSAGVREGLEKSKFRSGIRRRDAGLLGKRKREDDGENVVQGTEDHKVKRITESDVGAVRTTKSRGPKGPNPLSVKKAKKDPKPKSSNGRDSYEATSLRSGADSSQVAGDSAANRGQKELDETLDRPVQRKRKRKPKLLGPEGGVVALEET